MTDLPTSSPTLSHTLPPASHTHCKHVTATLWHCLSGLDNEKSQVFIKDRENKNYQNKNKNKTIVISFTLKKIF